MNRSKKLFLLITLFCMGFILLAGAHILFFNTLDVVAQTNNTENILMTEGASVRKDNPTGIRFVTKVDKRYIDELSDEEKRKIIYGTEFSTAKEIEVLDMIVSKTYSDEDSNTCFNSVIWNIPEAEYGTEVTAKSYFKIGVEGEKHYVSNPQTRSMAYVSAAALKNGEQDDNGFLKNTVDKALNISKNITIKDSMSLPLDDVVDYMVNDTDAVIENGKFVANVAKDYVITAKCGENYIKEFTIYCAEYLLVSCEEGGPAPILFIPFAAIKGTEVEVALSVRKSDLVEEAYPFFVVLNNEGGTKTVIEPSNSNNINAIRTSDIADWKEIKFNAEIVEDELHNTGIKLRMHFNAEPYHSTKIGQIFMFKNVNFVENNFDYQLVSPSDDLFIPSLIEVGKSVEVTLKIKKRNLSKTTLPFLSVKDGKNQSNVLIEPSGSTKANVVTTDDIEFWKQIRFSAEIVEDGNGSPAIRFHMHFAGAGDIAQGQTFMFKEVNMVEDKSDYQLVSADDGIPEFLIPCNNFAEGDNVSVTCKVKYFNIKEKSKPFVRVCKDNEPNGKAVTIIEPGTLSNITPWTEITFDAIIINNGTDNGVKLRMNFNADPYHSTQSGQTLMIKDFVVNKDTE